ncbi:hypothetical protein K435DRAFT_47212 [Dendrothele bispora CBS 962.96]|uniref:Uncharacterized protein n=1 Tax=Dendrothele bispora (strain CBS 962.96) TaxID=1314807 RepID=A0A4S8KSE5_DENBC|nr:hypothetical protein K435DRAFT_47212 [Dendrothele bispora CBS 962.96]
MRNWYLGRIHLHLFWYCRDGHTLFRRIPLICTGSVKGANLDHGPSADLADSRVAASSDSSVNLRRTISLASFGQARLRHAFIDLLLIVCGIGIWVVLTSNSFGIVIIDRLSFDVSP